MIRILGALLVIGGAAAVGFSAVRGLNKRVRTLRAFLAALELMERELSFRLTPMPELLDELSVRMPEPVRTFFTTCRAGLETLGERDLGQLWRVGLEDAQLGLQREELALLEELGDVLGRFDSEGQQAALTRVRTQLEHCLCGAQENRAKQSKMYGALGLSAGALLVIMLV